MKLKIGDKVRYLNEEGGGVVTKIIDNKTVEIEDETGFEVPVLEKELVLIDRNESKLLNIQEDYIEEQEDEEDESDEIDLSFLDEPEVPELKNNEINIVWASIKKNNTIDFYIINNSSYAIYCNIIQYKNKEYYNVSHKYINKGEKHLFMSNSSSFLDDKYSFLFQILFIAKQSIDLQSPVETQANISSVKLIKDNSYTSNNFFHEKAIIKEIYKYGLKSEIEKISEEELQKIIKQKQESEQYQKQISQKYKANIKPELIEVDLHINNLLDNYKGMSNTEILMYQLDVFHKEMKKAIESKAYKIVFIHGVGNGTLKHEVRKSLSKDYSKYRFQDASFKEYGFGATLVYLR